MFRTVNADALKRTLVLMYGEQAFSVVERVYSTINEAQSVAYNQGVIDGHADGYTMGLNTAEERVSEAFDNGFMYGEAEAVDAAEADIEVAADMSYDEGYLNGVADARARPAFADDNVQAIINEAAAVVFGEVEVLDEEPDDWCDICQQHGCMVDELDD